MYRLPRPILSRFLSPIKLVPPPSSPFALCVFLSNRLTSFSLVATIVYCHAGLFYVASRSTYYTTWSLVGEQPYCSLLCAMDLDFRFHSDEEPTSRVTCFVFRLSLCLRSRIRCPLRFPSSSRERSSIMGSSIVDCQLIASCYRDT